MGKHDAFSPKALANKMKAKGLQRLRWYCQMCEKQCRDENGFKCHLTSDGHMRMMQVFSENPKSFIDDFSKQFERGFMDIVRRKWRTKRVFANKVYQEYIADKEHVHMNGTRWESLAGFVMFLGKTGQCFVEETPKGWYIKYIERDPEVLARQEMIKQKERMDADDEMRNQKLIEKQLEFLATQGEGADGTGEVTSANEFKREDDSQKIQLALNVAKPKKVVAAVNPFEVATKPKESGANGAKEEKSEGHKSEKSSNDKKSRSRSRSRDRSKRSRSRSRDRSRRDRSRSRDRKSSDRDRSHRDRSRDRRRSRSRSRSRDNGHKRKYDDIKDRRDDASNKKQKTEHNGTNGSGSNNTNVMADLIKNQELKREKEGRKPFWLHANTIVKVMNKDLAKGKYYKQKGLVKEVFDKYVALVEILEDGTKIKIDQQDLETVIPNVGGAVMIVNGAYRGETAVLQSLEIEKFKAVVQIDKGPHRGHTVEKEYEDVCKLNV